MGNGRNEHNSRNIFTQFNVVRTSNLVNLGSYSMVSKKLTFSLLFLLSGCSLYQGSNFEGIPETSVEYSTNSFLVGYSFVDEYENVNDFPHTSMMVYGGIQNDITDNWNQSINVGYYHNGPNTTILDNALFGMVKSKYDIVNFGKLRLGIEARYRFDLGFSSDDLSLGIGVSYE